MCVSKSSCTTDQCIDFNVFSYTIDTNCITIHKQLRKSVSEIPFEYCVVNSNVHVLYPFACFYIYICYSCLNALLWWFRAAPGNVKYNPMLSCSFL